MKTSNNSANQSIPPPRSFVSPVTFSHGDTLQRLVWLITHDLPAEEAWRRAVWTRLKSVSGASANGDFQQEHMPALRQEIRRLFALSQTFRRAHVEASRMLVTRVLRGGEDATQVQADITAALHAVVNTDEYKLNRLLSAFVEREIEALH